MKTGSGGSPSVSRRQTASNTGSPGFTGAARYRRGLKLYRFPESDWAVFSARGPLPGSLQALNTCIWQDWYPNDGQQVVGNGNATLEVYSAGDMQSPDYACGIWVPIVRPQQTADDSAETAAAAALLGLL